MFLKKKTGFSDKENFVLIETHNPPENQIIAAFRLNQGKYKSEQI